MRQPSNNQITLGYGATTDPYSPSNPHLGVDWGHSPDDKIYAPEAGTIVYLGWMGTAGNAVELQGSNGRKWRLCHLQSFNVSNGQYVNEGHVLGIMGESGYTMGRHVHGILFIHGNRVDPMSVLPSTNNGAKLMTEEFIRRTYWLVQGREPSQNEIEFHLTKSNPTSFVNGFGNDPLWQSLNNQVTQLRGQVNDIPRLQTTITQLEQSIAAMKHEELKEDILEDTKSAELEAARQTIDRLNNELLLARNVPPVIAPSEPSSVVIPDNKVEPKPPKQSLLTKLILWAFAPKNKA